MHPAASSSSISAMVKDSCSSQSQRTSRNSSETSLARNIHLVDSSTRAAPPYAPDSSAHRSGVAFRGRLLHHPLRFSFRPTAPAQAIGLQGSPSWFRITSSVELQLDADRPERQHREGRVELSAPTCCRLSEYGKLRHDYQFYEAFASFGLPISDSSGIPSPSCKLRIISIERPRRLFKTSDTRARLPMYFSISDRSKPFWSM